MSSIAERPLGSLLAIAKPVVFRLRGNEAYGSHRYLVMDVFVSSIAKWLHAVSQWEHLCLVLEQLQFNKILCI
jgi:hypothetical protein